MQIFEPDPSATITTNGESRPSGASSAVTVVLADDHPLFRKGLAHTISSHNQLELVGEAPDGMEALSLVEEFDPDVALIDLKMNGLDGIGVCARITEIGLRTRVVLFSAFLGPQLVGQAVQAGAAGYIDKDASPEEVCYGVLEVARGGGAFRRDRLARSRG